METVKGPVVIPPQEPVRPDTGTPPDPQKADTGADPYIPPVEQQDDAQQGNEPKPLRGW